MSETILQPDQHLQNVLLLIDSSGSMNPIRQNVFLSVQKLLQILAESNRPTSNIRYKVQIKTFDALIRDHTGGTFLPPEEAGELFRFSHYLCGGITSLTEAYRYLDVWIRSSTGGLFRELPRITPPLLILITDMDSSDAPNEMETARRQLYSNPFFMHCRRIVICTGTAPEKRQAAAVLAGGDGYVLSLGQDLPDLIRPILADAAKISASGITPEETEQQILDKLDAGKHFTASLSDALLERELEKYLSI